MRTYLLSLIFFCAVSAADAQEYRVVGYDGTNNSMYVIASDGRTFIVNLTTYDTKAKIMAYLNSFNVPAKPTIPPGIQSLIGKTFDRNGNEL